MMGRGEEEWYNDRHQGRPDEIAHIDALKKIIKASDSKDRHDGALLILLILHIRP